MPYLTKEGVDRYMLRINNALDSSFLNGWEMEFLSDMMDRFLEHGEKIQLTQNQWHKLESVLEKNEPQETY